MGIQRPSSHCGDPAAGCKMWALWIKACHSEGWTHGSTFGWMDPATQKVMKLIGWLPLWASTKDLLLGWQEAFHLEKIYVSTAHLDRKDLLGVEMYKMQPDFFRLVGQKAVPLWRELSDLRTSSEFWHNKIDPMTYGHQTIGKMMVNHQIRGTLFSGKPNWVPLWRLFLAASPRKTDGFWWPVREKVRVWNHTSLWFH